MKRLAALLDSRPGRVARYLVSIGLIGWFVLRIDWAALAAARTEVAISPLIWALLIAGATYPLHALRWWLLLRAQGIELPFSWAHRVTWIGQFYNSFLLGGLGGDVARAYYVVRAAPEKKVGGLTAIFLDRATGLVVLAGIAVVALVTQFSMIALHPGLRRLGFGLAVALLLTGVAVFTLRVSLARLPGLFARFFGAENTAALFTALSRTAGHRRGPLLALTLSIVIWLGDFIAVWLLAHAANLPLPFLETCLAMSVAYAATVLPVSVGGHGVREGAMLGVFTLLGLLPTEDARQRALVLAVLVWGVSVLWSLVGGLVLLGTRRAHPSAPT